MQTKVGRIPILSVLAMFANAVAKSSLKPYLHQTSAFVTATQHFDLAGRLA